MHDANRFRHFPLIMRCQQGNTSGELVTSVVAVRGQASRFPSRRNGGSQTKRECERRAALLKAWRANSTMTIYKEGARTSHCSQNRRVRLYRSVDALSYRRVKNRNLEYALFLSGSVHGQQQTVRCDLQGDRRNPLQTLGEMTCHLKWPWPR